MPEPQIKSVVQGKWKDHHALASAPLIASRANAKRLDLRSAQVMNF
jgi:hypothetical protein